ncbi:MAG: hypothetical protein JWO58_2012 [Chitinophagaceae bacterium]|nr:hypothetical protein [Chitinophagaceae bacterium]
MLDNHRMIKVKFAAHKIYDELALLPGGLEAVRFASETADAFDGLVKSLRNTAGDWVIEIDKRGRVIRSFDLQKVMPKTMLAKEITRKYNDFENELFQDYMLSLRDTIEQGDKITVFDLISTDLFDVSSFDHYFQLNFPNKNPHLSSEDIW